jgi:hypothetical protein
MMVIRESLDKDTSFNPKTTDIISQVAHVTCKKDDHVTSGHFKRVQKKSQYFYQRLLNI